MIVHSDADFHARIEMVAEHFGNASCRHVVIVGIAFDIHDHHLPIFSAVAMLRRNENLHGNARAVWFYKQHAVFFDQFSCQLLMRVL